MTYTHVICTTKNRKCNWINHGLIQELSSERRFCREVRSKDSSGREDDEEDESNYWINISWWYILRVWNVHGVQSIEFSRVGCNLCKNVECSTFFEGTCCIPNSPPPPNAPHVLMDFVVLPPGHGRSVTDFWGWDVHEEQLSCPDVVSGDIGGCGARRALKPNFN